MKHTFTFSAVLLSVSVVAAQEIVITADSVIGPATQRASGFLWNGFSDTEPADSLVDPLKPRFLRGAESSLTAASQRLKKYDAGVETVLNWSGWSGGIPGSDGNWTAWENFCAARALALKNAGFANRAINPWNDADMSYSWTGTKSQFYETYRHAYNAIKAADPGTLVAGPGTTWSPQSSWKGPVAHDYTWLVRDFLDYCFTNNCVPDVVTVRDYSDDGSEMPGDVAAIRRYFAEKGKICPPLEEDDTGSQACQFRPGVYASYFASIERNGIERMARCCWDWNADCGGRTINSCVTSAKEKRSTWWAYKSYTDITGSILKLDGAGSIDGVAGLNNENGHPVLRAVVGRYRNETGTVSFRITDIPEGSTDGRVVAQLITNSEANTLDSLAQIMDQDVAVTNRVLTFSLGTIAPYQAAAITITFNGAPVSPVK